MKILLLSIGKNKNAALLELEQNYLSRLKHYCPVEHVILQDVKRSKNTTPQMLKSVEGDLILSHIESSDTLFLLDEKGKDHTSRSFADFLQKQMNTGVKQLIFVVGGAFGFSDEVYQRANGMIRLSSMTFSHEMVRVFFLEQLYRGFTIIKGEPYHND